MSSKRTLTRLDFRRGLKVTAIKRLILFFLPAILFGCAGFQTLILPMQDIESKDDQSSLRDSETCMEDIQSTDEVQKLRVNYYMSLESSKSSYKFSNNANVTEEEIIAFISYRNNIMKCKEKLLDYYYSIDLRYANAISEMYMKFDDNISMLLNKKINVGEYNKNYINIVVESKNTISNVDRIIRTENISAKKGIPRVICGKQLNSYEIQYLQQQKLLTQMTFKQLKILN